VEQRARLHEGWHPVRTQLHVRHGSTPGYGPGGAPSGQPTLGGASQGNLCSPTFVGLPVPIPNTLYNPHPNGCRNDGYITDVAWGYRVRVSLDYNNVFKHACHGHDQRLLAA
jgi:hypothetical protein